MLVASTHDLSHFILWTRLFIGKIRNLLMSEDFWMMLFQDNFAGTRKSSYSTHITCDVNRTRYVWWACCAFADRFTEWYRLWPSTTISTYQVPSAQQYVTITTDKHGCINTCKQAWTKTCTCSPSQASMNSFRYTSNKILLPWKLTWHKTKGYETPFIRHWHVIYKYLLYPYICIS